MFSPAADIRRLFFAVQPPADQRRQLFRLAGRVAGISGRAVAVDNLHLTLAFLGAVDPAMRRCMEAAADALAVAPFTLVLDSLGFWSRPQVVWFGASQTPPGLVELARRLNEGFGACGGRPDSRPYAAHLTVRRKVRRAPADQGIPPVAWPVTDFVLMESITLPEGVQYRVLKRWPLKVADPVRD